MMMMIIVVVVVVVVVVVTTTTNKKKVTKQEMQDYVSVVGTLMRWAGHVARMGEESGCIGS